MYQDYYNLKEHPFNVTADPDFFYSSTKHSEAFSHLVYGIKQRKGILLVTGEVGTGKTTLCRTLLNRLDKNTKTALILNPRFSDLQLLKLIMKDLGVEGKFRNKFALIDALNQFLLNESSKGNNVVVIIDEAQNLKIPQLEQIRLLSNLETEKEKLLQIILVGQPELDEKLRNTALRQLNQRITVRYHILPLDQNELSGYIHHRLQIASGNQENSPKFTEKAINAIYEESFGTPRMINILCDRALLAGYVSATKMIDEKIVHRCAKEIL
ncbi:General secretion pathway protein A [hydrothermal vent metagenome]|uniref:General secretion pathway protein A n=1 Tax=hydrothermal vent metagenome TaxID=652676 RepID=A0A3B0TKH9_9ZZZZ